MPYFSIGEVQRYSGAVACAELKLDTLPTAGDFLAVGDDWYEFCASTPPTGSDNESMWVYRGLNAAASRANIIKAINGVVDATIVSRAHATNTTPVLATDSNGRVLVLRASSVGGTPVVGPAPEETTSDLYSELTEASDGWSVESLTDSSGMDATTDVKTTTTQLTILQKHVDYGRIKFFFPFNILSIDVVKANGSLTTDKIVPALRGRSGEATLNLLGDLQAGDIIVVTAVGTSDVIVL